jgi:hypothetical protein
MQVKFENLTPTQVAMHMANNWSDPMATDRFFVMDKLPLWPGDMAQIGPFTVICEDTELDDARFTVTWDAEPCIHPGVFANSQPTTHCWACDTDVPRELL